MSASLSESDGLLARAVAELDRQWDGTAAAWRDKARADFEKHYLDEVRWNAKAAGQAMRAIHQLLRQAIQDCS